MDLIEGFEVDELKVHKDDGFEVWKEVELEVEEAVRLHAYKVDGIEVQKVVLEVDSKVAMPMDNLFAMSNSLTRGDLTIGLKIIERDRFEALKVDGLEVFEARFKALEPQVVKGLDVATLTKNLFANSLELGVYSTNEHEDYYPTYILEDGYTKCGPKDSYA